MDALFFQLSLGKTDFSLNVLAFPNIVHNKAMIGDGGRISFREAPRQRGEIVTLEVDFVGHKGLQNTLEIPVLGRVTSFFLESWVLETLRRFKALMETGEVPTLAGQPTGRVSRNASRLA